MYCVQYYKNVIAKKGLFTSDATLFVDTSMRGTVKRFADYNHKFIAQFIRSMQKLSLLDLLTGQQGEIRQYCRYVNPPSS